jgi:hypothetical protein
VLAIDGDYLERLDVFHVGENGYVWGPGMAHVFPRGHVGGLLPEWLNVSDRPIYRAPHAATVMAPDPKLDGIQYRELAIQFLPMGALPIQVTDQKVGRIEAHWPPEGAPLPVVSVDQETRESAGAPGPLVLIPGSAATGWIRGDGPPAVCVVSGWPPPFDVLVPAGSGLDSALHWARMSQIAAMSETRPDQALLEGQNHSRSFLTPGSSSWDHAYLWPIYAKEGAEGAAIAATMHFGLPDLTLPELLASSEWLDRAARPIPVLRAWGGVGLMWALLLEQLEQGRRFGHCEACGRIISRWKGRRFCHRDENSECVRRRARVRQGQHRSSRRS